MTVYYPTPEDFFTSLFPKQPVSSRKISHNYRLVVAYFAPTLLVNTKTARANMQENPGGWRGAEIGGTVV
jgi:hypothetical protein